MKIENLLNLTSVLTVHIVQMKEISSRYGTRRPNFDLLVKSFISTLSLVVVDTRPDTRLSITIKGAGLV